MTVENNGHCSRIYRCGTGRLESKCFMLAWRLQRSWIDRSQLGDLSAGRKVQNFKWANSWFTSWVRYQCGQTLLPIGRPFGKPTRIAFHLRLLGTKSKTRRLRSALPIVKARIWRPELIEPAAERKRRARVRRTFKSADSDPKILPQCNISSNYISVAEASLVNHERFPGRDVLKSALLNGQTWFARSGTRVAELGSPAGLKNIKQNTHAVIGHQNFAAAVKKL